MAFFWGRPGPRLLSATERRLNQGYATFFLLAAADAVVGVVFWPVELNRSTPVSFLFDSFVAWHSRELAYGFLSATLGGFLVAALPRWTGRATTPGAQMALLAIWIAGRVVDVTSGSLRALVAAFPVALAAWASGRIFAAHRRRDAGIAALLVVYAIGAMLACAPGLSAETQGLGVRSSVAALSALVLVVAGRVIPALTQRLIEPASRVDDRPKPRAIGAAALTASCVSLALWTVDADGRDVAAIAACAGVLHLWRLLSWRGWRAARVPAVLILHIAYLFAPLGFALQTSRALLTAFPDAPLHVFAAGLCGVSAFGIMSSVDRKRMARAFRTTRLWRVAAIAACAAAITRLGADVFDARGALLALAALSWAIAFLLFAIEIGVRIVPPFARFGGALLESSLD